MHLVIVHDEVNDLQTDEGGLRGTTAARKDIFSVAMFLDIKDNRSKYRGHHVGGYTRVSDRLVIIRIWL